MDVGIAFDDADLTQRLDRIGRSVRQALIDAFTPLAAAITADARARAAAHIHVLGAKPGQYLASIQGGVSTRDPGRIVGYVRSASPVAHILEYGAQIPPHDILPRLAQILAFEGSAGLVFAKAVHAPGATIPPYPALHPALAAARSAIEAAVERAAHAAGDA